MSDTIFFFLRNMCKVQAGSKLLLCPSVLQRKAGFYSMPTDLFPTLASLPPFCKFYLVRQLTQLAAILITESSPHCSPPRPLPCLQRYPLSLLHSLNRDHFVSIYLMVQCPPAIFWSWFTLWSPFLREKKQALSPNLRLMTGFCYSDETVQISKFVLPQSLYHYIEPKC